MIEFQAWPKTPRLFRDMVITEKLDGTNAAVIVEELSEDNCDEPPSNGEAVVFTENGQGYIVGAQSRKRLITPADDNYGFARWAFDNATALARILGPGRHFGEWWGSGIQRGYGLTNGEKRFSLFNVNRHAAALAAADVFAADEIPALGLVPVLARWTFDLDVVRECLDDLKEHGSHAADFDRPEGVVVYHTAAGQTFKALLENDDQPKGNA